MEGIVSALRKEKRSYSEWDDYWYGPRTEPAASGIEVTAERALGVTALWAGVSQIAGTMGSLSIDILRKLGGGGKEPATEHLLYPVLERRPNRWMRRTDFFEMQQGHLLTRGNSYSQVARSRGGKVLALVPLHPGRMSIELGADDSLVYVYQRSTGERVRYAQDEILHVRGLSSNGVVGYSPVTLMREAIGLAIATERHGAKLFANDARPGGLLTHPHRLTPEARKNLKTSWHEAHSGEKAHSVAILEEGLKWEAVGFSSEDSQFIQARGFQVVEVARMLNISPNRLQDHSRATFSNIEHLGIEYATHTIRPWIIRWQEALETALLSEKELDAGYIIRFNEKALLQGDTAAQSAFIREMMGVGIYSINEGREILGLNPIDDGDKRFVPVNMIPLDKAGDFPSLKGPPDDDDDDGSDDRSLPASPALITAGRVAKREERTVAGRVRLRDAHGRLIRAEADRLLAREINAARRALKKDPSVAGFTRWIRDFYADYAELVARAYLPILSSFSEVLLEAVLDEVGSDADVAGELERFVRDYDATLGIRWQLSSSRQLEKVARQAGADVLEETVSARLDHWEEVRGAKIASKETVQANGAFTRTLYTMLGFGAVWVSLGSACPMCSEMNGRKVGAGEGFLGAGDSLDVAGSAPLIASNSIGHPPLHAGCDCIVIASIL